MANQIEYIKDSDLLFQGTKKINDFAIDPANRAEDNSIKARTIAEQTQQQLDSIVVDSGNSDIEVVQARGKNDLLYKRFNQIEENADEIEDKLDTKRDNTALLSMSDMGQDVKKAMTGNSVAVVDIDMVIEPNIVDKAVTPRKLRGVENSIKFQNLFDKTRIKKGYLVDKDGKEVATDPLIFCSDYIDIESNQDYIFPSVLANPGNWYTSDFKVIAPISNEVINKPVFKRAPSNAKYVRWNGDGSTNPENVMIARSTVYPNRYVPFTGKYKLGWLDTDVKKHEINMESIIGIVVENAFNKETALDNLFIHDNGNIVSNEMFSISDYIPVFPGKTYYFSCGFGNPGCGYDKDKNFVRVLEKTEKETIDFFRVIPEDCYFIRINMYRSSGDKRSKSQFVVAQRDTIPSTYKEFGAVVPWIKIPEKNSNNKSALQGKKIVTFGDSVTDYDGKNYTQNTVEAGKKVYGYQSYMRENLGAIVENQGVSGNTTQQIAARIKNYDFTNADVVSIFAGINNFRDYDTDVFGEVKAINSTFDETSFLGSYQASIEYILKNNPSVMLVLIIPFKCWTNRNGLMPVKYRNSIIELARIYGLPVCNLYDESGFNELTSKAYIVDDTSVNYKFHPSTKGYKRISDVLVPFFENNYTGNIF